MDYSKNYHPLYHIALFWQRYPALHCGLTLALAIYLAFGTFWALIPLPLVFVAKNKLKTLLLLLIPWIFVQITYSHPQTPVKGTAHFSIQSVSPALHRSYLYRGTIKTFTADGEGKGVASHFPCNIYSSKRWTADRDYQVHGILDSRNPHHYRLKTKEAWQPIPNTHSFAERRFHLKTRFSKYLQRQLPSRRAGLFLTGLATGELGDRALFKSFGNLGVSHILAISGFHFAILAAFFHLIFRTFLPTRISAGILIIILTGYFLFIGNTPSIQRAWIMAFVYLLGQLLEKRTSGINNLGVALCLALVIDPLALFSLGFQLSFAATLGIFLLYSPFNSLLKKLIPKEKLSEIIERSLVYQHLYLLGGFFREALSLTLAVHLALFPILIFTFHNFSFHSLIYNLFFPFLASLSLILLITATLLHTIFPPLGSWLHHCNGWYTKAVLSIADHPPIPLRTWYIEEVSLAFVTLFLTTLFITALFLKTTKEPN